MARVKATALEALTHNERNAPTQVGHAMNNPVVAPMLVNPPLLFEIENALTARATFNPTKYETTI